MEFATAAEHLTSRVPIAAPTARAGDIRPALVGNTLDTVAEIAFCEDDRLVGLLNIEGVLAVPEDIQVCQIVDRDPPVVMPGVDQEVAAWKAVHHGESGLALAFAPVALWRWGRPDVVLAVALSLLAA